MTLKEKILEIFHIRIFGAIAGGYNAAEDIEAHVMGFFKWFDSDVSIRDNYTTEDAYNMWLNNTVKK